jgi:hypothetical protein
MGYNNKIPMPDKYLLPDGSIKTFSGVEVASADTDRAEIYNRMQLQAAKWLMPNGSIVSAIPISTKTLDAFTGDSGAGGTKGLVPAPASGDGAGGKFLAADGSWKKPPEGGGGGGGYSDWNTVTDFTATPASTSTLTMTKDLTATIQKGQPLRYTISGTVYYGIVGAIADDLLTVNGAPLGGDVTKLEIGDPNKVAQVVLAFPDDYEKANDTAMIKNQLNTNFLWQRAKAYLVKYTVWSEVADTGDDGKVSVRINGAEVNTSAGGLTIVADETLYSTVVNIDSTAYDINPGESLEVTCLKGTNGNAENLTVTMLFVIP